MRLRCASEPVSFLDFMEGHSNGAEWVSQASVHTGPVYLRDCISALREKDASRHEAALHSLQMLLASRPVDLDDVALPLAKTLL